MYILDTDHLSFIQRNGKEGQNILTRLATLDNPEVAVTIITYEEQVRGRLLFLSKAKTCLATSLSLPRIRTVSS